jgi:hypothetical protein
VIRKEVAGQPYNASFNEAILQSAWLGCLAFSKTSSFKIQFSFSSLILLKV